MNGYEQSDLYALLKKEHAKVKSQELWIDERGGTLQGYIETYGSQNDPEHYGDGGEKIYQADLNALYVFVEKVMTLEAGLHAMAAEGRLSLGTVEWLKQKAVEAVYGEEES